MGLDAGHTCSTPPTQSSPPSPITDNRDKNKSTITFYLCFLLLKLRVINSKCLSHTLIRFTWGPSSGHPHNVVASAQARWTEKLTPTLTKSTARRASASQGSGTTPAQHVSTPPPPPPSPPSPPHLRLVLVTNSRPLQT